MNLWAKIVFQKFTSFVWATSFLKIFKVGEPRPEQLVSNSAFEVVPDGKSWTQKPLGIPWNIKIVVELEAISYSDSYLELLHSL